MWGLTVKLLYRADVWWLRFGILDRFDGNQCRLKAVARDVIIVREPGLEFQLGILDLIKLLLIIGACFEGMSQISQGQLEVLRQTLPLLGNC